MEQGKTAHNKPYIIGITGGSGSGKTSFIRKLRASFTTAQICVVSQDDYYRPLEEQEVDENNVANFDLPKSINKKAFYEDLLKLMNGETIVKHEYTFNNRNTIGKEIIIEPAPIIIVEGLFVFHYKKIKSLLDLKIYFHAKDHQKVIRRIIRDQNERNYPIDDVMYRYEKHVEPSYKKFILPYIDEADIIINNTKHFDNAYQVIAGFLSNLVNK